MKRIRTLEELNDAANNCKSVVVPEWRRIGWPSWREPRPAAFVIGMTGRNILLILDAGMFVYEKQEKIVPHGNAVDSVDGGSAE